MQWGGLRLLSFFAQIIRAVTAETLQEGGRALMGQKNSPAIEPGHWLFSGTYRCGGRLIFIPACYCEPHAYIIIADIPQRGVIL
jgi:hypothetical protein